jgi:chromosome segregation protein
LSNSDIVTARSNHPNPQTDRESAKINSWENADSCRQGMHLELMVHIKQVELSHFKSFGGTTKVPILPGFTVVSGPNGSGKSNILDALLFCLGLASSKGMRAERLPDLVNHDRSTKGVSEAIVTVTFDLENEGEEPAPEIKVVDISDGKAAPTPRLASEWVVTRRLRVNAQGGYTSNYSINGEACNLAELHDQLNALRIYPEGYNVVLQGDVTSIISMNSKERREIIDELAGVAAFDRKIDRAKDTLDEVKEKVEKCNIVAAELVAQRDRLAQDKIKAEKYQRLRTEFQQKSVEEVVLKWQNLQQKQTNIQQDLGKGKVVLDELVKQVTDVQGEIGTKTAEVERLNACVKALGEERLLAAQAELATQQAEQRQLEQQQKELTENRSNTQTNQQQSAIQFANYEQEFKRLTSEQQQLDTTQLKKAVVDRDAAKYQLEVTKERASSIASASTAWVEEQTQVSRQIETTLQLLSKQRTAQAQLTERRNQLAAKIAEETERLSTINPELETNKNKVFQLEAKLAQSTGELAVLEQKLTAVQANVDTQLETQKRLLQEQRDKQRLVDKLEAQNQVQQEAQGSFATKIIKEAKLAGVHGLVAQLGNVDPAYQLALEIAAGARLGNLVVEDDGVASRAIEILKQKRGGRATFLPLNKINAQPLRENAALRATQGFIDYAVNLVDFGREYENIFNYVFGGTLVFDKLDRARSLLGRHRIVTLDGELLESSGAMTGGNISQKSTLHFGTADASESAEVRSLQQRLGEIEQILQVSIEVVNKSNTELRQLSTAVADTRQNQREIKLNFDRNQQEITQLTSQQTQLQSQIAKNQQDLDLTITNLTALEQALPAQEAILAQSHAELAELEKSGVHSDWQVIQTEIKAQEQQLQQRQQALTSIEQKLQEIDRQRSILNEKISENQRRTSEYQEQITILDRKLTDINTRLTGIGDSIATTKASLVTLEQELGTDKQERDKAEAKLRQFHLNFQELQWEQQKLTQLQQQRQTEIDNLIVQIATQRTELPAELPELPPESQTDEYLAALQSQIRLLQKRMEGMEPVNMLALEAYEETNNRLQELSDKLGTLEAESMELLLRIENFTTLRFQAFSEAFDAVNLNFQDIFAELSDGDGFLQLEDPQNPFSGGLNLVAHPKGKPVQRLSSMSGGEKSLTALSFIFALQRYRPSPFYAFDEVDMFLDGANVERLSKMIRKQADRAQFLVVSLRRPMIEAADRTIGVTQARGAYTQVLGINLKTSA